MKQITQATAGEIAAKMTVKLDEVIISKRRLLLGEITSLYRDSLPKEVLELFQKQPRFFDTSGVATVDGNGFLGERFSMLECLPYDRVRYGAFIEPNKEQASRIQKLNRALEDAIKKHDDVKRQIKQALLALKTRKNIEANFPEALPFLPQESTSTALIPNLSALRHQISALAES